jgi:hypothetical protein
MLAFARLMYHVARLHYFRLALTHSGHGHPDAAFWTMQIAYSASIVNRMEIA